MKKLSLIALLLVLPFSIHAQLDKELWDLTNHLTELYIQLGAPTPLPPAPEPPKPEPVQAPLETWADLVKENNKRKAESKSKESELTVFHGTVAVSISTPDLTNLLKSFRDANPDLEKKFKESRYKCGTFYKLGQLLHLTLLYFKIPIETKTIQKIESTQSEIESALNKLVQEKTPVLKEVQFEYAEQNKTMGSKADKQFFAALFNPSDGINSFRNIFTLPFVKSLFSLYPYAWIDFLENPDYHISLAVLKEECVNAEIKIPDPLPAVSLFKLEQGTLKASVILPGTY